MHLNPNLMIAINSFILDAEAGVGRTTFKPSGIKKRGTTSKSRIPIKMVKKTVPKSPVLKAPQSTPQRTSDILRRILDNNPGKLISVQKIVDELGPTSFGASLMVFSLPELLPVHFPGFGAVVAIPNGILASQMIRGKKQIQLPRYLLRRSISRKFFAGAVHAILPSLQRIEKAVKPSGNWVTHPWTKRFLGGFILSLAGVIALPIPWTCTIAAIATILIGLGMVEKNGTLVILGILIGLASIALVGVTIFGALALLGF